MKKVRFSIGGKILGGFLLLLTLFAITAITSILTLNSGIRLTERTIEVTDPSADAIVDFMAMVNESEKLITSWVYLQNNEDNKQALKDLHHAYPQQKEVLMQLSKLWDNDEQVYQLDSIFSQFEALLESEQEIMSSLVSFDDYEDPMAKLLAENMIEDSILPRTKEIRQQLTEIDAIKQREAETAQSENIASYLQLRKIILALGLATIVLGIIGALVLSRMITRPISYLKEVIVELGKGRLPEDDMQSSRKFNQDEVGEMADAVNGLVKGLRDTSAFAENIGKGQYESEFSPLSEEDVLGNSLLGMRDNLQQVAQEDKIRNWATEGSAKFGELLRQNSENVHELTQTILSNLITYMHANQGGLYIIQNEAEGEEPYMSLEACYAWDREKYLDQKIYHGEGLAGQAWQEKDTIYLTDVPDDYITITSGLGDANPTCILIIPLVVNEQVYGVIELASFEEFKPYEVEFMQKIAESIASTISSAKINTQTQQLLEESQQMTEQMQAQEEEMRQNMEELQATQEEMHRKQRELENTLGEAKQREAGFEESENRLFAIINNIPKFIFWKNKDLEFMGCNDAFAKLAGATSSQEVIGKTDFDFWPDNAEAFRTDDQQIIDSKEAKLDFEESQTDNQGNKSCMRVSKVPLTNQYGEVLGVLGMFEDITAYKDQLSELEETKQQLQQTEEELKQIVLLMREKGLEIEEVKSKDQ
uniref:GAF domain-containing protein n=1 Tax=Roseihalotalea indica TaxID=2867963 RepID=A0AA49GQR1_9BACT|nr:GAF domain-containing protein [Tunicatimonas sp. TK19036]